MSMSIASHQEAALQRGEHLYAQAKLEDSFGAFRKVILLCSCNKDLRASSKRLGISSTDIPLPICHCKDYLSLPIDGFDTSFKTKEAIFILATRPCSCGSGIESCHNPAHIKALINIANVHVAQKSYSKAMQYASLAITLAPHLPEGYLRMVTVIRKGGLQCTPDIPSRCNWFDTQACHIVRAHGNKNHEMLQLVGRRIRRDIVRGVPAEVRQMILQNLSNTDIYRAMGVSKAWKLACQDRQLWKDLQIVKNWRHTRLRPRFRPGVLNNIVKLSGHMATSLTIDGLWDFKFDGAKLRAMLKALPKLKTLSLTGHHGQPEESRPVTANFPKFSDFWAAIWEDAPSTLTTLHLNSFRSDNNWKIPRPVLKGCRFEDSLEELSLVRLDPVDADLVMHTTMKLCYFPPFKNLTIKHCGTKDGYFPFTKFLPEQAPWTSVTLDEALLTEDIEWYYGEWYIDWSCLERLVLGKFDSSLFKFPTSEVLRSLELNHDGLKSLSHLMWREPLQKPRLPALEHFRCHYDPHSADSDLGAHLSNLLRPSDPSFAILRPSIENGTLRSLDLTFSGYIKTAVNNLFEENQKEAIRILSCHHITMPSIVSGYGGNCDEFLDWVETFPKLTTVGAYPQKSENAYMLILWLMNKRPDIKTIYTNVLQGAGRDRVLAEAAKRLVRIIHADRVPEPILEPRK